MILQENNLCVFTSYIYLYNILISSIAERRSASRGRGERCNASPQGHGEEQFQGVPVDVPPRHCVQLQPHQGHPVQHRPACALDARGSHHQTHQTGA